MGLMIDKPAKTLIERFAQKQPGGHFACPRCGKMTMDAESVTHNALSRRIGCYICDTCGTVEALEDFAHLPCRSSTIRFSARSSRLPTDRGLCLSA